jgi:hypothetical protein
MTQMVSIIQFSWLIQTAQKSAFFKKEGLPVHLVPLAG